jgi:ATP-dependent Zn protease
MSDSRLQDHGSIEGIVGAAREFGLADADVWSAMNDAALNAADDTTVPEFMEDLSMELARRILGKERHQSANSAVRFSR